MPDVLIADTHHVWHQQLKNDRKIYNRQKKVTAGVHLLCVKLSGVFFNKLQVNFFVNQWQTNIIKVRRKNNLIPLSLEILNKLVSVCSFASVITNK